MTAYSLKDACPHCHASGSPPPAPAWCQPCLPRGAWTELGCHSPVIPSTGSPASLQRFPKAGLRSGQVHLFSVAFWPCWSVGGREGGVVKWILQSAKWVCRGPPAIWICSLNIHVNGFQSRNTCDSGRLEVGQWRRQFKIAVWYLPVQ